MSLWSKNKKFNFQYQEPIKKKDENHVVDYARTLIKSDINKGEMDSDYNEILKGSCVYLKNFFCNIDDVTLFNKLKSELDIENNVVEWSKHEKCENPQKSETFNMIIKLLSEHFKVNILETRLNYYKNGLSMKPFHQDKNAFGNQLENYTMGASFGASRVLDFKHIKTNNKFSFPQNNGDVFAFTQEINKKFMHAIPKSNKKCGDRISIIAWGIRSD